MASSKALCTILPTPSCYRDEGAYYHSHTVVEHTVAAGTAAEHTVAAGTAAVVQVADTAVADSLD